MKNDRLRYKDPDRRKQYQREHKSIWEKTLKGKQCRVERWKRLKDDPIRYENEKRKDRDRKARLRLEKRDDDIISKINRQKEKQFLSTLPKLWKQERPDRRTQAAIFSFFRSHGIKPTLAQKYIKLQLIKLKRLTHEKQQSINIH